MRRSPPSVHERPKNVVLEHLRIKCPGQELPLGLPVSIIKAKSGIYLTERKSPLKLPTVGNLELN